MKPTQYRNLAKVVAQLESCGFECEAGPLRLNDAFLWLKDASKIGPEFWPGQGVFYEVEAEVAGETLRKWAHFYIVGCRMSSDAEKRFWLYDLSNDPPRPYHYGKVQFRGIKGNLLRLEMPS